MNKNELIEFTIRKVRTEDAESLAKYLNNKKIYEHTLIVHFPYNLQIAKDWIKETLEMGYDKPVPYLNFIIEIHGEAVGVISLEQIAEKEAELGYWLAEKYWNQGIMTEAIKHFTKYAFDKVGLKKITVPIFTSNVASQKVMEKCGYKKVGKKELSKKDEKIPALVFVFEKN